MKQFRIVSQVSGWWRAFATVIASVLLISASGAQDYPTRSIRIIVGTTPGGSNDIVARHLAPKLGELLGAQFLVDNRPGANGIIGTELVAKAPADGYTIFLGSASYLVLNSLIYAKLPFDIINDFAGIASVATTPEILAVNLSVPARSLKELVQLAKAQPGKLDFASSGIGGLPHLAIELFKTAAEVDVGHVAYKGAAPALTDLLGGQVKGFIIDFPVLYPHIKAGKIRGLAVLSERRASLLPDLPTSGEQGLPTLLAVNWFGVLAPAKTPRSVVDTLHTAFSKAASAPEIKERLIDIGVESMTSVSPEAFTRFQRDELARWGKVVKQANVKAE